MTKLWATEEQLKKLVSDLLASTKSGEQKIDEAAKLGVLQATKAAQLDLHAPTQHGTLDAGLATALEQRASHKAVAPRILPASDPMAPFVDGTVAAIKGGR